MSYKNVAAKYEGGEDGERIPRLFMTTGVLLTSSGAHVSVYRPFIKLKVQIELKFAYIVKLWLSKTSRQSYNTKNGGNKIIKIVPK